MQMISIEQLTSDLSPFCDPGTDLQTRAAKAGIEFVLTRNGIEQKYFLDSKDSKVLARHEANRVYSNLKSLFASQDFADLKSFTANQKSMLRNFDQSSLLDHEGEFNGISITQNKVLVPFEVKTDEGSLNVVIIDGPAGIGKTYLIQRLLSKRHSLGGSATPVLHVSSRGQRMSSLNGILALSLQLVRAKFTFDQIPILVRYGLLQVAIDGFDELVDPNGYRDAWGALENFLRDIGSGGPVVLAGRDSFFDQHAFKTQLGKYLPNLKVSSLSLHPTSTSKAKYWLRMRGWSESDIDDPYTDLVLRRGSYALRPYFLSVLASSQGWSKNGKMDLSPRQFMIDRFLDRETKIISGLSESLEIPFDKCKTALNTLFEEVALEMRETESDSVDTSFLNLVTEYAFSSVVPPSELPRLQHKSSSIALLDVDQRSGFRRFPHSEISNHFLAKALISKLAAKAEPLNLRRSILQVDLLAVLCEVLLTTDKDLMTAFILRVRSLIGFENSFDQLPGNLLSLAIASLGVERDWVFDVRQANTLEASFSGFAENAYFEDVNVGRLALQEANVTGVKFMGCTVETLVADDTTKFGSTYPTIKKLTLIDHKGDATDHFEPDRIQKWINEHSTSDESYEEVNEHALKLFDRMLRAFIRQHQIKKDRNDLIGKYLFDGCWDKIEAILLRDGQISTFSRGSSGVNAPFLRMRNPSMFFGQHAEESIYSAIWNEIGNLPT
jgi:hypothetical protein